MMNKSRNRMTCVAVLLAALLLLSGCGTKSAASDDTDAAAVSDILSGDDLVALHEGLDAVYDGTFRSQMLDEEKIIYDALVQHIVVDRRTDDLVIDFSSADKEIDQFVIDTMANGIYWAVTEDYPEASAIMYDSFKSQYEDGHLKTATISFHEGYDGAYEELDSVRSSIDAVVEEIKATRASESRYDTAKAIHDYICNHASYDYASLDEDFEIAADKAHEASPLFGGGSRGAQFVCEGYAKAFKLLCAKCDVPCYVICGEVPWTVDDAPGEHAWNYVQMEDGKWYGVDVTWDDPDDSAASIRYTHFLSGKNTPDVDEFMLVRKELANATFAEMHMPRVGLYTYGVPTSYSINLIWLLHYPELADEAYQAA